MQTLIQDYYLQIIQSELNATWKQEKRDKPRYSPKQTDYVIMLTFTCILFWAKIEERIKLHLE